MSEEKKMRVIVDQTFKQQWAAIEKTMARVLAAPDVQRAKLTTLERRVRYLCPQRFGSLYVRIYIHMAEHVVACRHRVDGGARFLAVNPRDGMLDRYAAEWTQYQRGLATLDQLLVQFVLELRTKRHNVKSRGDFEYLESETVALEDSLWPQDMIELGLATWQHFMLWPQDGVLWPRVTEALLAFSEGAPLVDERALRATITSTLEVCRYDAGRRLDAYRRWVLEPYLRAAKSRHAETAAALLDAGNVPQYMRSALAGKQRVRALADLFLHPSSREAVVTCYEKAAITPHLARLQAEAPALLSSAAIDPGCSSARDDLKNLYSLLRQYNALRPLRVAARAHVLAEGRRLLAELTDEREMHRQFVQAMGALDRKYKELFADAFEGTWSFMTALDKACTAVVRSLEGKRESELLARYFDDLLRAPEGAGDDAQGEERVATAILVFRRIDNTDAFYEHYQKALAIRVLEQSCVSMQREEAMINRLKELASSDCARKIYKMHDDVSTSATLNGRFKLWHEEVNGMESSEFSVLVLQKWAWPLPEPALPVPAVLKDRTDLFEMWYGEQRPRHRLAWHHCSTGELALHYTARQLHVTATVPQCAMLLAFETEDRWSSKQLRRHLQLQKHEWAQQLRPLLDLKLLLPNGDVLEQGAGVEEGEEGESTLTLNLEFADERTSIKIACAILPPKQPAERAEAGRGIGLEEFLQAKIVRVMKQRQTLQHDELVKEVEAETRPWFSPAPELIMKCIECLIRKEYLERVTDKSDTYAYLP